MAHASQCMYTFSTTMMTCEIESIYPRSLNHVDTFISISCKLQLEIEKQKMNLLFFLLLVGSSRLFRLSLLLFLLCRRWFWDWGEKLYFPVGFLLKSAQNFERIGFLPLHHHLTALAISRHIFHALKQMNKT